ncbi:MAG: prepilin-type N-terminal cleavage/methylation domain-containing protein, partial [Candidatus Pacebacteria bacterium]|nr:prepilin-type N-terminal cleavage/methylation domain-containing protein [Candidatus Paceibacterota bacterium]
MNKKAFTLIELLVVIAIIGILSGFVFVQLNGATDLASDAMKKADIDAIKKAVIMASIVNGSYPIESSCNIGSCSVLDPLIQEYIPNVIDGTYTYQSDGSDCKISTLLSDNSIYEYNCSSNEFSTLYPTGGVCGASNLETFSVAPEVGLCSSGVASTLNYSQTDSAWSWNCVGENSGATASCLAYYESNYLACSIIPVADTCEVSEENQANTSIQAASILNIYSLTGAHAELATEANYLYKVCCEGTSLTNSCSGGTSILNLSSVTNAHVEKNTQGYYANSACLSSILKTIT